MDKSDFIRTRLTHSLEVSSFAKSLGQNVAQKIIKEIRDPAFLPEYQGDMCDILQCAGLLHDIGNPPFGHFGEVVIREWFGEHMSELIFRGKRLTELLSEQMQQDFYHFEGNTQALRLISKLHYLVDEHGMNLTMGLMGTIIKYPVSSLEIDKKSGDIRTKKMGYFYAEKDVFDRLQESLGTKSSRHPLAFLLEAADDIAYKTADIEDAFKKGCITYENLLEELCRGVNMTVEEARAYTGTDETCREYLKLVWLLERRYQQALTRGMAKPAMDGVQNWIVSVQGHLLGTATDAFVRHYHEIMEGTYRKELLSEGAGALMAEVLGDIAYRYAFISQPIFKLEIAAETILTSLLDRFVKAAISYDTEEKQTDVQKKLMSLVSDNYKAIYSIFSRGKSEEEKLYLRLLLITDYICGMTDSHAKQLYQEFCGIV